MRIALLGPFEVHADDGGAVEVPGARLRALLAALALEPGRIVPRERLVDWVWGERPPGDEANALQRLVSRLRKALPRGAVEADYGGYRLAVEADAVDLGRFEQLVARAASADDAGRAGLLRSALDLWRGDPLDGIGLLGSRAFDAVVAGLSERRLAVLADRVEAELRLGRGSDLIAELTDLVARYPLREGFTAALMRALAETGRGAEALTLYRRMSERLAEELGADPSAELSALHTALLRGEIGGPVDRRRTNLRAELTRFVGKEDEVAAVARLARSHRLVTLTGPGGSGKTRIAAETARTMLGDLPDGAWMVGLAPLRAGGEPARAALTALGLRESLLGEATDGEADDRLVAAVRDRVMLVVLDNCEHMIEEASVFADRLLAECPRLRIIATSREPLRITGEVLWQVEPLALPPRDSAPAAAGASPAVRLLRDRAEAVRRDVASDERTSAAMARICRALDGMPLAIELAAARLRTMSVEQLADRLDDRFALLTGGSRTALAHHRTLRAVVDWSWDLLDDDERGLMRRLSVFSGGVSIEAARRLCPEGLELLTSLTEKSLLRAEGEAEPRYRMLETIREYAAQRLAEAGETEEARRAQLAYLTELAETADPHLRRADQLEWLAALEAEHDNIAAALRGAIEDGWAQEAMRLAAAAGWYWFLGGHRAEGTELSIAAASLEGEASDEVRAMACTMVTLFTTSGYGGDQYQAKDWIERAHRLAPRASSRHPMLRFIAPLERMVRDPADFLSAYDPLVADPDPWVRAQARLARGRLRLSVGGDATGVESEAEAALAEFRTLGDRWGISSALMFLADRLTASGRLARAGEYLEEAAAALDELGATEEVVGVRARQATLYWMLGDERASDAAMALARREAARIAWPDMLAELAFAEANLARWRGETVRARALLAAIRERFGADRPAIRISIEDLGGYLAGDPEQARLHRAEAFAGAVALGHPPTVAAVLVGVADLARARGDHAQAVRLLEAADRLRGTPDRSQPDAARIFADAHGALDPAALEAARREGRERDWRELAEVTLAP